MPCPAPSQSHPFARSPLPLAGLVEPAAPVRNVVREGAPALDFEVRACADERCGKALPPGHRWRFCGRTCRRRARDRERTRERAGTGRVHGQPAFIRRLRQEVPEGQCVYCPRLLSGGQKYTCANKLCRAAYVADWHREARGLKSGTPTESTREVVLAAECAVHLGEGRARLAVQLDALRARVREFCASLGVGCPR